MKLWCKKFTEYFSPARREIRTQALLEWFEYWFGNVGLFIGIILVTLFNLGFLLILVLFVVCVNPVGFWAWILNLPQRVKNYQKRKAKG